MACRLTISGTLDSLPVWAELNRYKMVAGAEIHMIERTQCQQLNIILHTTPAHSTADHVSRVPSPTGIQSTAVKSPHTVDFLIRTQ